MSHSLSFEMPLNNCNIAIEFDWYGEEPDWDNMVVMALLPSAIVFESKHWVEINDVLSESDWKKIEFELHFNETEIKRKGMKDDY